MPWTLAQYQARVQALAASQSPTSDNITDWVNECLQQKLQPHANMEASDDIALVSGTQGYALPSDFYEMEFVYRKDSATSAPRELIALPSQDRTSRGYRLRAGSIYVQPTPGAGDNGKKLYLEYTKRCGRSTDGATLSLAADTPNIPEEFHDLPFLWACVRAKQEDDEFGEGRDFKDEFDRRMSEFITKRSRKPRRSGFRIRSHSYFR